MQILDVVVLIAITLTIAAGAIIGARLMTLARRTRGLPEAALGIGLFIFGAICQPLALVMVLFAADLGPFGRQITYAIASSGYILVLTGLAVFAWQAFGPRSMWRCAFALALIGAIATGTTLSIVENWPLLAEGPLANGSKFELVGNVTFDITFMWMALESLRSYSKLRRQAALGLSDPVVINRILVWGIGSATSALLGMAVMYLSLNGSGMAAADPISNLLVATSGLVSSLCWTLAFLPPRAYVSWVEERATARA